MIRNRRNLVLAAVAVALVFALSVGAYWIGQRATRDERRWRAEAEEKISALRAVELRLRKVADVDEAVALAFRKDDPALYVASKAGRVFSVARAGSEPQLILDVSSEVTNTWEQGFLGITFDPEGSFLYAYFTDAAEDIRVFAYPWVNGKLDRETAREILFVDDPHKWHNAGHLTFGPDGYLYVALGDGGIGFARNAQQLDNVLGSIIRIDPTPTGRAPYRVPDDNPFVGREGARPEIWVYGVRNPWRFSFDRETRDLWIADVGAESREEIDVQPAGSPGGENYGWPAVEGTKEIGTPPVDHVLPVYEYPKEGTCVAIIGGYVYRGRSIPGLDGVYVFGDFCDGELRGLIYHRGRVADVLQLGAKVPRLSSFAQDDRGNLYALSLIDGVFLIEPDVPEWG